MYQKHQQMEHDDSASTSNKNSGQCIAVLRELQALLGTQATLDDILSIVHDVENEFGSQTHLETAIQSLVGQNLEQQIALRKQRLRG